MNQDDERDYEEERANAELGRDDPEVWSENDLRKLYDELGPDELRHLILQAQAALALCEPQEGKN